MACLDVVTDAIEAVAAEVNTEAADTGGRKNAVQCDVTDENAVAAAVATAAEELGFITNLCNIAGIGGFAHTHRAVTERMGRGRHRRQPDGDVSHVPGRPARHARTRRRHREHDLHRRHERPFRRPTAHPKATARLLTMALAVEYIARGVRVNGVAPGGVDTPIIHNFGPPEDADWKLIERLMSPIGFAYPHEVTGAFAYLGSSEADYITGAILSIDGAITT